MTRKICSLSENDSESITETEIEDMPHKVALSEMFSK